MDEPQQEHEATPAGMTSTKATENTSPKRNNGDSQWVDFGHNGPTFTSNGTSPKPALPPPPRRANSVQPPDAARAAGFVDPLSLNDVPLEEEPRPSPSIPSKPQENVIDKAVFEPLAEVGQQPVKKHPERTNGTANHAKNTPAHYETGKLITAVYPTNKHCAWVSPPVYDATDAPSALTNEPVKLSPDTYANVIKAITEEISFTAYAVLYPRALPMWITLAIVALLIFLWTNPTGGLVVLIMTFMWTIFLFVGIFVCVLLRKYLVLGLRQTVKDANRQLLGQNVLTAVEDRGHLSCHKVVILFVYYELQGCVEDVERLLRVHYANNPKAVAAKNDGELRHQATELLLDYAQAYMKACMKKQLLFPTRPSEGVSDYRPKHCKTSHCLCQYVEKEYFNGEKKLWYERLVA